SREQPAVLEQQVTVEFTPARGRGYIAAASGCGVGITLEINQRKSSRVPELIREVATKFESLAHHGPTRQRLMLWLLRPLRTERLTTLFAFNPRQHAVLLRLGKRRLTVRTLELNRKLHVLRIGREVRNSKPQRIGPEFLDHIERINA